MQKLSFEVKPSTFVDSLSVIVYTILGIRLLSSVKFLDVYCESIDMSYAQIDDRVIMNTVDAAISNIYKNFLQNASVNVDLSFRSGPSIFETWKILVKKNSIPKPLLPTCIEIVKISNIDNLPETCTFTITEESSKKPSKSWLLNALSSTLKSGLGWVS